MKQFILFLGVILTLPGCGQQSAETTLIKAGGPCEGCKAIFECPVPFDSLNHILHLPGWNDSGQQLEIKGIVRHLNGSPAAEIVLYAYQTNPNGIYPVKGDEKGWGKRHGTMRGWLKTNEKGEYRILTLKPGSYPGRNEPAHIHVTVKQPGYTEYWIDDFLFEDDPLLTPAFRNRLSQRGGNGILKTVTENSLLKAERDIILGKNIPGF